VLKAQLGVNPSGAVGAITDGVDLLDPFGQERVRQRPIRRRWALPVMKAPTVHAQRPAHHSDRIVGLLRGDQAEYHVYRPSVSRAKKAAAFLTFSRSIRNV
jgi:hypothetical protein